MGSPGLEIKSPDRLNQNRYGIYLMLVAYACAYLFFALFGYWWFTESSKATSIYFVRESKPPADLELRYSNVPGSSSAQPKVQNAVLIRERDPDDRVQVVYWSPKRANEWGSIEIDFQWDPGFHPEFAVLDPSLHIFRMFDADASGEIAISSPATNDEWVTLASAKNSQSKFALQYGIDVTRWIKGAHSLRVRYRIKASRLMYHPTPNDPIGLAAAQCLRQQINSDDIKQSKYAMRLRLWKYRQEDD